jgi:hypothetical protein
MWRAAGCGRLRLLVRRPGPTAKAKKEERLHEQTDPSVDGMDPMSPGLMRHKRPL